MRKFGLIGYPLGHSFSKSYFSEKFRSEGIRNALYELYPLQDLPDFIRLVSDEPDLIGLNVTIPYKSEIIRFLDFVDPEAEAIGAVNVIKIKRFENSFELFGYNSDVTGIRDTLFPYLKKVKSAIVLGTGGSSKAVCWVLDKLGIPWIIVSRIKKPQTIDYSELTPELIQTNSLIINTTPVGMYPEIEMCPDIDYKSLSENNILFDLVYNPERTLFLRKGEEMGCKTVGGLQMLHSQAERAWKIWNEND